MGNIGYEITTRDGFTDTTWRMTEEIYIQHVLDFPRDEVTAKYRELYREVDSITYPYESDGETLRPGISEGEEILLSDEDVKRFAEQDFADGPTAWAYTLEDLGYEEV